jgi:hypothetical protein
MFAISSSKPNIRELSQLSKLNNNPNRGKNESRNNCQLSEPQLGTVAQ